MLQKKLSTLVMLNLSQLSSRSVGTNMLNMQSKWEAYPTRYRHKINNKNQLLRSNEHQTNPQLTEYTAPIKEVFAMIKYAF